jgi:SAM-dependent methyltransferase
MTAIYDRIGSTYARYRQPDPRIAAAIDTALADTMNVANVGAGTGSYEPHGRGVIGLEPSRVMIEQRPRDAAPVIQGVAERLPFRDASFDAALAILTVHHWPDAQRGLYEMQRVAPKQVVLTWDPAVAARFWLVADYLPQIAQHEADLPTVDMIARELRTTDVRTVNVPWDCSDGFLGGYWRRPEQYLDPDARVAISSLALMDDRIIADAMRKLARDLEDGSWHRRHADLLSLDELDLGYRLVVATLR